MKKALFLYMPLFVLLLLSGCAGNSSEQPSYQENKKMVLDMLKTDEGKKTIKELLEDKEMRTAIVFDSPVIKKTIIDTLHTDQGKELWADLIKDPSFAKILAQAMMHENESLLKKMMKQPDYQGMMMDVLRAPKMEQDYLSLLRTKPFRDQLKTEIQEAIASPAFNKVVTDTIQSIMKKQSNK
ncbi:MAG: spore germination lipoprotein GerD [Sporolactobacillus sp.]